MSLIEIRLTGPVHITAAHVACAFGGCYTRYVLWKILPPTVFVNVLFVIMRVVGRIIRRAHHDMGLEVIVIDAFVVHGT